MILSFALESLLFLRLSFPSVLKSFGSCQVVHRPGIKLKVLMKCGTGKIHPGHELTREEAQSWSDKMSENISQYRISNRFYSFLSSATSHDNYFLMFHSRLIIELYHASLSHNKANFPTKIYNQFAWTVGVTALLRSLLTSRGDGTPTHDGGANCESLLATPSQNSYGKTWDTGTESGISENWGSDDLTRWN